MAAKYDEDEKPQVQLTSMMDCIFLMLIFFLVSSQLKKIEKEVPLELPEADVAQDVKAAPDLTRRATSTSTPSRSARRASAPRSRTPRRRTPTAASGSTATSSRRSAPSSRCSRPRATRA